MTTDARIIAKRKTVTIHRTDSNPLVLRETDRNSVLASLLGFDCSVAEVFAAD